MLSPLDMGECVDRCGVGFLFAPLYHPCLASLAPIRKELKIKTVFNILGPLLNPASPRRMVLGVNSSRLLPIYAQVVRKLDMADHALIVHCCGMDEFCMVGNSSVYEVKPGQPDVAKEVPPPILPPCRAEELKGGDATYNAGVIRELLSGKVQEENMPNFHTVALNAGAVLYVSGLASSIQDGFSIACETMKSGSALRKLEEWSNVAQELDAKRKRIKG